MAEADIRLLSTPTVRELLATRSIVGTTAERYIWQGGTVADKPAFVSGNVAASQLYAGDFTQTWLWMWGRGVQIEINPYADFRADVVGMRVVCYAGVAVTHPAADHVSTGVT